MINAKAILQLKDGYKNGEAFTILGCNLYGQKFVTNDAYIEQGLLNKPDIHNTMIGFGFGDAIEKTNPNHREFSGTYLTEFPTYKSRGKTFAAYTVAEQYLYILGIFKKNGELIFDNSDFVHIKFGNII